MSGRVVADDVLGNVAEPERPKASKPSTHCTATQRNGERLDLGAWLLRFGVEHKNPRTRDGLDIFDIQCPIDPEHGFDAWAGQATDGKLSAACYHATCPLKTWRDLRDHYEPMPIPRSRPSAHVAQEPARFHEEDGTDTAQPEPWADPTDLSEPVRPDPSPGVHTAATAPELPDVLVAGSHINGDGEIEEVGSDDFVRATLPAFPPGVLYRRAVFVGELQGEPGSCSFEVVKDPRIRILADQHIRMFKWARTKEKNGIPGRPFKLYHACNTDQATLIRQEATTSLVVRDLKLLTCYPVATGPDFRIVQPGFNAACGTFYDPPESLRRVAPLRDMARAHAIFEDLVVDFPFKEEADRQNFFGLLLTPHVHPAMPSSNAPMHMPYSSLERTGKTKLASDVAGGVSLGTAAPTQPMVDDVELDKRITALLRRGGTMIVFDNINTSHSQLESAVLSMLLTTRTYTGRILSRSEDVTFHNPMLTVVGTANNPRMNGELAKRIIPIALQPATDHPEARTDFKYPDLSAHIARVRVDVLSAILGIVEVWKANGRPMHAKPLGGFEEWSRVVAGMLSVAGFNEWGSNLEAWHERSDPDGDDLRVFVKAWAERLGNEVKRTTKDLLDLALDLEVFEAVQLAKPGKGQQTAFGKMIRTKRDTPVGEWCISSTGSGSSSLYFLRRSKS